MVQVLIVVDGAGAIGAGTLRGNVYMVDNEKYLGSWGQGESELHTLAIPGQVVCWRIEPIVSTEQVGIVHFEGPMVEKKVCVPVRAGTMDEPFWMGRTQGAFGRYEYRIRIDVGGIGFSLTAWLELQ